MIWLRQWLVSVVSCAFFVRLLDALTPEGAVRQIARFAGGLVLLLCMLRPLGAVELDDLTRTSIAPGAERAALERRYQEEQTRALEAVIAERTGAYIEDKAHALGVEVTAEVSVREEDGTLLPDRVVLTGEENAALSALIAQELAIPRERQEWREKP